VKRAQLLGNVHSTTSLKRALIEYLKRLCGGGETRYTHMCIYSVHVCIGYITVIYTLYTLRFQKDPKKTFLLGRNIIDRDVFCAWHPKFVTANSVISHSSAEPEPQTEPLIP
jgi:hypothetical protein